MNIFQKAVQRLTKRLSKNNNSSTINSVLPCNINEKYVKRYTKSEMAILYNRSYSTFIRRVYGDEELMHELNATGYQKKQKEFKKEQVRIIFKHLGEPDYPQ